MQTEPCANRRQMLALMGAAAMPSHASDSAFAARQQVTFVVPFNAGGVNDAVARLVGSELGRLWRQTVVVDNRPGAGGLVGLQVASKGSADGHTLTIATNVRTFGILSKNLAFNPSEDLAPISTVAGGALVLAAAPTLPVRNAKELVTYAQSNPGALSSAVIALTLSQLDSAYFYKRVANVDVGLVPYNTSGQAIPALAGGHVHLYLTIVQTVKQLVDAGKLRVLGVAAAQRDSLLRDVPTLAEQGLPFEASFWLGLYGPKRLPRTVAEQIGTDLGRVLDLPSVKSQLEAIGLSPRVSGPAEMERLMEVEERYYREAARIAGIA